MEFYKIIQPFLLVLVTAFISGYLIPKITRRWQNHHKDLELKTEIVSRINESVIDFVLAVQFMEVGVSPLTQEQLDDAYINWERKQSIISSNLRVYFPRTALCQDWNEYSDIVTEVYALSNTIDKTFRAERLGKITDYFPSSCIDWSLLLNLDLKKQGYYEMQTFLKEWFLLKEEILKQKDYIVQRLLDVSIFDR